MDEQQFDQLVKRVAGTSRRQVLGRGLLILRGLTAGGVLTVLGARTVAADRDQQSNPGHGPGGNPDPGGQGRCGRFGTACPDADGKVTCSFTLSDSSNCGGCLGDGGSQCAPNTRCCGGQCVPQQGCEHCFCCNPDDPTACHCVADNPLRPLPGVGQVCRDGGENAIVT